jgi:hypothetical protein
MVLPRKIKGIVIASITDSRLDEVLIVRRFKSISQAKKFLSRKVKVFHKIGFMTIASIYTDHGYRYSNCTILNYEYNVWVKIESDKPGIPYWAERISL